MNTQNEEVIQLVKRISGNRLVSRVPEILEEEEQNFKNNENNMKMTIEKLMEENNLRESLMNLSKLKHAESQKQIASQVQKAEYFDDQDVRAMNEEHSSASNKLNHFPFPNLYSRKSRVTIYLTPYLLVH